MGIDIRKISITDLDTDAIVNAANSGLRMGGGVCGAIFRSAGPDKLQAACNKIGGCSTGDAVITPGFNLKARYVIHAVGPIWNGGNSGEAELLYGAYKNALNRALENNLKSIAFPLISAGIYGYPTEEAWQVAISAVRDFLEEHSEYEMEVIFAVLDDRIGQIGRNLL